MVRVNQSLVLLILAGAIAVGLTLWRMGLLQGSATDAPSAWVPEPAAVVDNDATAPSESSVRHPVETPWTARLGAGDIGRILIDLLGAKAVATFVQTDEFPRRLVTTIDNLGRSHAPAMLWPVHPTPDRFTVEQLDGAPVISVDNSNRYTPLVLLVEEVDAIRVVSFYIRMYPLLQRAYEELGFPEGYFNDRVIDVIDVLLAAPEVEYPVKLQLTEVKGPISPMRPWVRYEFADPDLESLSAGQKILLRVGTVNQRRLKGKLAEFRQELVKRSPLR
jgi:Protein of unknown function (DUF3014)